MRFRNHHAGCCGFVPTHPDGTEWAHQLTLHDGSTVHADTAGEVLEELIAGYGALDDRGRLAARVRLAERLATQGQEVLIAASVRSGTLDPSDADDAALVDILRVDKGANMALEDRDAPGAAADWVPQTPLVLVSTGYAPHTGHARIGGNTRWLDPASESGFLASLRETGFFDYWTSEGPQRP